MSLARAQVSAAISDGLRLFYRNDELRRSWSLTNIQARWEISLLRVIEWDSMPSSADPLVALKIALQNAATPADQVNDQDD